MEILESMNWELYRDAWMKCMSDYYWYREDPVFDWNRLEELEEMESEFGGPGRLFLEAKRNGDIVGILGIRFRGKQAVIRRWEPAALKIADNETVPQALLYYGMKSLTKMGIQRTTVLVKFPVTNQHVAGPLMELYQNVGFERYEPDGVDFVMGLEDIPASTRERSDITIDPELGTDAKNIAEYIIRAYASTPDDKAIHGHDSSVSKYDDAFISIDSIQKGRLGPSPPDFWKVAIFDGEPAGFIGGFIRESKFRPVTGILGPLGVFPEYRRHGIALHLILELLATMKQNGCEYSAVGTPAANRDAIAMYEKAGYKLASHLVHLEKRM